MLVVDLSTIEVRKRQRTLIAKQPLAELRSSILKVGLAHPPVCWPDGEKWVLEVGERRLNAIREIAKENLPFNHGTEVILPGKCPITPLGDYLDEVGKFELELDENLHRVDLDWKEKTEALAALHSMREAQNPGQTFRDTGREALERGAIRSQTANATLDPTIAAASAGRRIRAAVLVSEHLHDQKIAGARTQHEALQLIYKAEQEKVQAALARRKLRALEGAGGSLVEVRNADLLDALPALESGRFDLLVADPPYGIGASGDGFRSRTIHHHDYNDTEEAAREIALCILTEGFRVTKSRANIFIFCDIDLFPWLKRTASNMGWVPFRRPLVWVKSESEGLAPWGAQGPRITTEYIFFATKGQRGMLASPVDVFSVKRVPRNKRIHAAEKPVELIRRLIECTTMPGDEVLDPCCGSGSTLVACEELRRRGLGIEKDPVYYNTAMANVHMREPANGDGKQGDGTPLPQLDPESAP